MCVLFSTRLNPVSRELNTTATSVKVKIGFKVSSHRPRSVLWAGATFEKGSGLRKKTFLFDVFCRSDLRGKKDDDAFKRDFFRLPPSTLL